MAKDKPVDPSRIDKDWIALEKLRITKSEETKRLAILCFFGTISLGIIAWATVRLTDRPSWLVFALAILAAIGGPSVVAIRASRRRKTGIELEISRLRATRSPDEAAPPKIDTSEEGET